MNKAVGLISKIILTSLIFTACTEQIIEEKTTSSDSMKTPVSSMDPHSYANLDKIYTKHLHLDLDVNFDNKSIYGIARHKMVNLGTETAIFDTKYLDIEKVTLGNKDERPTDFVIGKFDSILGSPLMVTLGKKDEYVNIYYKTTEESEALDWLSPEQTAGKKLPYLYTQGEAILTRSWIPVQGSPSNRITYSADVKVPKDLLALMSASNPKEKNETGLYHFEMKQPIPVYLIALAIGDIAYKSLGVNCGVYAEPQLLRKSASELVDLPKMISAAEKLYGAYRWEQYDVVFLPYAFPFGGMENPRLTFANPTLITGDRSLVSVIAHELAHSWSGNLVTNKSWEDFWLNEGFTVYFENRIMEELYGKEVSDILVSIEFQELQKTLKNELPDDTKLKLHLDERNPDDGMTDIAYIKGASFLRTLEATVGREKMDVFIKGYFNKFAFKTLTTEDFIAYLDKELLTPNKIDFNTKEWIYEPGLPSNCIVVKSERLEKIVKLADDLLQGKSLNKFKKLKRKDLTTQEWQAFIRRFPTDTDEGILTLIDKQLNFKNCGNSEIMAEWYVLGIQCDYAAIKPNMKNFLNKVGRRKYLEPIYETLAKSKDKNNLIWAREVYDNSKANYHFLSKLAIEEILKG